MKLLSFFHQKLSLNGDANTKNYRIMETNSCNWMNMVLVQLICQFHFFRIPSFLKQFMPTTFCCSVSTHLLSAVVVAFSRLLIFLSVFQNLFVPWMILQFWDWIISVPAYNRLVNDLYLMFSLCYALQPYLCAIENYELFWSTLYLFLECDLILRNNPKRTFIFLFRYQF